MDARASVRHYEDQVKGAKAGEVARYHFDGKVYTEMTRTHKKVDAEAIAKECRGNGFLARVIKLSPTYPSGKPRGYRYAIAARRKD